MDDKPVINLQQAIGNLLDKLENEEITVSQAREVAILLKAKIAESQAGEKPNGI